MTSFLYSLRGPSPYLDHYSHHSLLHSLRELRGGVGKLIKKGSTEGWERKDKDSLYLDRVYNCHGFIQNGGHTQTFTLPDDLRIVFLFDLDLKNVEFMNTIRDRFRRPRQEMDYGKDYLQLIKHPREYDRWVFQPLSTYTIPDLVLDFTRRDAIWERRAQGVWLWQDPDDYTNHTPFLNGTVGWSHVNRPEVPKNIKFSDFLAAENKRDVTNHHFSMQPLVKYSPDTSPLRTWYFLCCGYKDGMPKHMRTEVWLTQRSKYTEIGTDPDDHESDGVEVEDDDATVPNGGDNDQVVDL